MAIINCLILISDLISDDRLNSFVISVDTFDSAGNKVAFNQTATFLQRAGGFGGKRSSDKAIPIGDTPKRNPDASIKELTSIDQVGQSGDSGESG